MRTFGASRITVGRAVRDLQAPGWSSGGRAPAPTSRTTSARGALSFGLLIPDLGETEIFEPICQGMMASPLAREHALVWGSLERRRRRRRKSAPGSCAGSTSSAASSGVFFAPLELTAAKDDVNRRIAQALDDARIPDRAARPHGGAVPASAATTIWSASTTGAPATSSPSTCCASGSRRIAFVALPNAAATVDAREAGYREALYAVESPVDRALVHRLDPADVDAVRQLMESARPDAIVCANDRTAGRLMQTLLQLGYACPRTSAWSASTTSSTRRCCRCR